MRTTHAFSFNHISGEAALTPLAKQRIEQLIDAHPLLAMDFLRDVICDLEELYIKARRERLVRR